MKGRQILSALNRPIGVYRLFRRAPDGSAEAIPFQIDELDRDGDYVLDHQTAPDLPKGNGIFTAFDELAFMGNDVGPVGRPTRWPSPPAQVYEIHLVNFQAAAGSPHEGAVYLAVYPHNPPPLSPRHYVDFDRQSGTVSTSRYRYQFDQQNYLVVRGVDMLGSHAPVPLLDSSTFYLKADLKYFLTFEANHRSVNSAIEAYKVGPVRAVVRVSFFYTFLKLNFQLGMYTEVSFFSNAVILPAVLYNPLDGKTSLNKGSGFYYGFALDQSPNAYHLDTNIPTYHQSNGLIDVFSRPAAPLNPYWISLTAPDRMMYVELRLSSEMRRNGNTPSLFVDPVPASALAPTDSPEPLGKSPVNMALYFDLTRFNEGAHAVSFRLFFENYYDKGVLDAIMHVDNWQAYLRPL